MLLVMLKYISSLKECETTHLTQVSLLTGSSCQ